MHLLLLLLGSRLFLLLLFLLRDGLLLFLLLHGLLLLRLWLLLLLSLLLRLLLHGLLLLLLLLRDRLRLGIVVIVPAASDQGQAGCANPGAGTRLQYAAAAQPLTADSTPVFVVHVRTPRGRLAH